MAHYKRKKSKVPLTRVATKRHKKHKYIFVSLVLLVAKSVCSSLALVNQQCIVSGFHTFGTEIEILPALEHFNHRRAFQLALDQRL